MTAYDRVAQSLRQRILDGAWPRGAQLPTERELCGRFETSRITVRRALDILEQEMLVERRQGAGTFVAVASQRRIPLLHTDFSGSIARHAPELRRKLHVLRWDGADAATARLLHISVGDRILHAMRIDALRRQPVAVDEVLAPAAFADQLDRWDLADLRFVERWQAAQRLRLNHCVQSIEAIKAPARFASLLRVRRGEPMLKETSVFHLAGSRLAGVVVSYYRHDCFRFDMTIPIRRPTRGGPQNKEIRS